MGKSTRGSFTMRASVISFGILLLVPAILADTFTGERVKVGKKTCTCDFTFTVAGNGKAKGTGACDKKCSGKVADDTEQCRVLVHLRIQCQEGQGQGGESYCCWWLYYSNNHAFRVWIRDCDKKCSGKVAEMTLNGYEY